MSNRPNQASAYPAPGSLSPLPTGPVRPRGFYARRFRRSEVSDLDSTSFTGLREEIQLMRVLIRRLMDPAAMEDPQDAEEMFRRVQALHISMRTLAFLLLADRRLSREQTMHDRDAE